jgi:carbon storage regulator
MLVLSRKLSQEILIGSDITITVVRIEGNHVRLGIEAPPGVSVLRDELISRQQRTEVEPAVASGREGVRAV